MIDSDTRSRPFEVGTTGWSADDFDDPEFEALWEQGRYEIVEGVLTKMPAHYGTFAERIVVDDGGSTDGTKEIVSVCDRAFIQNLRQAKRASLE